MGRPKDPNSRRSKAAKRRAAEALSRLAIEGKPNEMVLRRRERFSFLYPKLTPTKVGEVQRVYGEIDQLIHDGIGQLQVLGKLDGHGHTSLDLRNIGRLYAELYWERYEATAPAVGSWEARSPSTGGPPPRTKRDDLFDRLDNALSRVSMERTAIHMLLTNHFHSDKTEGWVQRLINRALVERGVSDVLVFFDSATEGHDRYMLGCAIRGLSQLMDASLPSRYQRRAA